MTMTSAYSDEARTAARELRARLKRDLAAGRFVSSSTGVRRADAAAVAEKQPAVIGVPPRRKG